MTLTRAEALAAEHDAFQNAFASVDLDTNIRNFSRRGDIYVTDRIQAMWEGWQKRAAHFAAEPAEGFVLVPREPTEAMLKAGGHANSEWLNDYAPIGESRYARPMESVWKDMLAAAPTRGE